jgi:hypothetical protein
MTTRHRPSGAAAGASACRALAGRAESRRSTSEAILITFRIVDGRSHAASRTDEIAHLDTRMTRAGQPPPLQSSFGSEAMSRPQAGHVRAQLRGVVKPEGHLLVSIVGCSARWTVNNVVALRTIGCAGEARRVAIRQIVTLRLRMVRSA